MRFVAGDHSVYCMRETQNPHTGQLEEEEVARFNADLEVIAPHVAAALYADERRQLDRWLEERRAIRQEPKELQVLKALPQLLDEATTSIDAVDQLDEPVFADIARALSAFQLALKKFDDIEPDSDACPRVMDEDEALKERLKELRREIDRD